MAKHKMLWILHEGNKSGANMALLEYFGILKEMGYTLSVIVPANGTLLPELKKLNIPYLKIPYYPWTRELNKGYFSKDWLRKLVRNTLSVLKFLPHTIKHDIICTNTICVITGVIAAKISFKPHYLFVHEFGEEDHGFKLAVSTRRAYKLYTMLSKKIAVNSNAIMNKWLNNEIPQNKLCLLYNAVEIKESINSEQSATFRGNRFLLLGQISQAKGHKDAICAIKKAKDEISDLELDIIGSANNKEYTETLKELIETLELQNSVRILPPVESPTLIFNKYKALLMCSRNEAFGRVTVEALKCGLPVIGSNSGGTPEIVSDGFNGFLYTPSNTTELSNTIIKMCQLPNSAYQVLSENSKNIGARFNKEVTRKQFESIFK